MTLTPTEPDFNPPLSDDDEPHNPDCETLVNPLASSGTETSACDKATPAQEPGIMQSSYWFEDGNVILVADDNIGFRVHRGILAHHSSIFCDLFGVAQPECGEALDGCPIVPLSDSADDLNQLMRAGSEHTHKQILSFSTAAPLLELAHKYNIEHLSAEVLARMRTVFCHQLTTFAASAEFVAIYDSGEKVMCLKSAALMVTTKVDAIRAVNLIRLVGELAMLPMALYLCTLLPITTLLSGTTLTNGRVVQLAQEDLIRCLEARTTLALRTHRHMERVTFEGSSAECTTTQDCNTARQAIRLSISQMRDAIGSHRQAHALYNWERRIRRQPRLCNACVNYLIGVHHSSMRYVWDNLPADFHLSIPQWQVGAVVA
ncbi:hypothetical protein GY45DRAFT_1255894 [Cubamyces sp. BRFM 1775]|nr:hypothetical protein GY45DRAFT_1255894 [Cubamyces sp. BRFM 1775]